MSNLAKDVDLVEINDLEDSFSWLNNARGSASKTKQVLLRKEMSESKTLEELGSNALDYLTNQIDLRVNPLVAEALAKRLKWVRGQGSTLQEAAALANITRERIRQIQLKFEGQRLEPPIDSALCRQVIDICKKSGDTASFLSNLRRLNVISPENAWSTESIAELIGIVCGPELKSQIETEVTLIEPYLVDGVTKNIIRRLRNKIGLIEVGVLAREANLTIEHAFEAIRQTYFTTVETSSLVLANQNPPGTFLRTIGVQLLIKDGLSPAEILEGINRQIDSRQDNHVGSRQSLIELIEMVAGNPCRWANLPESASSDIQLSDSQIWFREIFHNSTTGLLHRDQIAEAAIDDDLPLGSAGAWTSYSPILRKVALGVYCLVGTETSSNEAEIYRTGARANSSGASLDFSLINSNLLQIRICPSYGTFEGGAFYASSEIYNLIAEFEFRCECSCRQLKSDVRVRLTPSRYLIGFTPLLTHAREEHGIGVGDEITIDLNYRAMTACLQIALQSV
jgi:hypothetical protein